MDIERKREIDKILMKTEEEMKREDFDPMKAGIPLEEFLKIQAKKREMRNQKMYNLKVSESFDEELNETEDHIT